MGSAFDVPSLKRARWVGHVRHRDWRTVPLSLSDATPAEAGAGDVAGTDGFPAIVDDGIEGNGVGIGRIFRRGPIERRCVMERRIARRGEPNVVEDADAADRFQSGYVAPSHQHVPTACP